MTDVSKLTIESTHNHLVKGDFSARELSEEYLKNIEVKNKDLNAYLEVFDDVLKQADEADKKLKSGKAGILTGIPLAIKDNILIKGRTASAASKILENYKATYDATAIEKLKEAGAVFLGRTNMDEFAMGGSTENSAFGVTKNPHDTSRVAGGSSGGSAAAVASDLTLAAIGSDTGGSVREPASFCGVVGFKPTYGAISRYGLMAMGSSLDQIGPITKTVSDAEILFNLMKGQDSMDSTTLDTKHEARSTKHGKMVIGIPVDLLDQGGISKDVIDNFNESVKKFKDLGYEIREIKLPNIKYSLAVYYIVMPAEVSSNMARFDGVKYGALTEGENLMGDYMKTRGQNFGREVRRRIMLGTYVLSAGYYDAYYGRAQAVRHLITDDFKKVFDDEKSGADIILTPTTPTPAFKIGEKTANPLEMYLADIFTVTANIVGVPAMSVPSGFSKTGDKNLPLGIQLTATFGGEETLFKVGKDFLGEKV